MNLLLGAAAKSCSQRCSRRLRTNALMLSRFIGVTDIAAIRFSLPSQLLEPIPNLGMRLKAL